MKKKILSLALVFVLTLTLVPAFTAPAQAANPHYFATALGEFVEGKSRTAAVLVDLNGDGVNEVVAIHQLGTGYDESYEIVVFDQISKTPVRHNITTSVSQLYISNKNYIIYAVDVAGPTITSALGYENGQLVEKVELREILGEYDYEFSLFDLETGSDNGVAEKYGIKSVRYLLVGPGTNRVDQTAEILAMTAAPSAKTVSPTASTVYVNGTAKAFEAYMIDGNNYFKLRDLATVLSGTAKQFEVGYNNDTEAITLTSGKTYTSAGGEMAAGDGQSKTANPTTSKIYLDGKELNLTVYTINDNNFFKLRDLMQAINVYVGYDDATKNITLDTSKGYVVE